MKKFIISLCVLIPFWGISQLIADFDDVQIPMRDGEFIEADVYIPAGVDSAEVILIQTPYNKELLAWNLPMGVGLNLDSQPFIWVIVDWRGFYGSAGADLSNFERGEDGYDVCEWISQQTWHRDRIGTWGPSALGSVQYLTAREQHPNHTCAVPLVATPNQGYDKYFYGGVLEKARLEQLDALGYGLSPIVLANPYDNIVWQFSASGTWFPEDIIIPTLQIGGWYDHAIDAMMDWYEGTRNFADPSVQDEQWLLVGPWVHGGTGAAYVGTSVQGELNYPNAEFVSDTMAWDFLNYYLLDAPNGWNTTPLITYYETGLDQWNTSNATGIEETNSDELFLDGNLLSPAIGTVSSPFVCDPHDPSPTIGGQTLHTTLDQGPYDQIALDSRNDVIHYTSHELTSDVQISGRVQADLYVSSDQPDGDIVVRLVDQYPDGRNMLINDGIHRLRFRSGGFEAADEEFMTPGTVYNVTVDLPYTNYTWLTGHRIKVYISGNSSYRWDVNLQNGQTMYAAGDTNVANIMIHQSATYPSSISLPGNNNVLSQDENTLETLQLALYPNPTSDFFSLRCSSEILEVKILNQLGQEVKVIETEFDQITTASLVPGSYLVKVKTVEGILIKRLSKL